MTLKNLALSTLAAAGILAASSAPALAGNWACQVALCLSNPGGPTQYAACVPPINRLYTWLADPLHAFPVCAFADGSGIDHYQAVILLPKTGSAIASGAAWVIPLTGRTSPDVITVNGTAVQIYQNFQGKVIGFPY